MKRLDRASGLNSSALSRVLFGLLVLGCLLAMHGFQVTASPAEMVGLPLTAASAEHDMSAADPAATPVSEPHDGGSDRHKGHTGNQVCLAVLTFLSIFALLVAVRKRRWLKVVFRWKIAGIGFQGSGRSPSAPTVYELTVLRL